MSVSRQKIGPGSALYVPSRERAAAMSLGAVMVEGDARLHIPAPLPDQVEIEAFERWTSPTARIVWISEFLEGIVGHPVDLNDVAGLVEGAGLASDRDDDQLVPLYVPTFEMDNARHIPGVFWDRRRRCYVADRTADFGLVFRYLTPAMRAVWVADRNLDTVMSSLVRARAILAEVDDGDERGPIELEQGHSSKDD